MLKIRKFLSVLVAFVVFGVSFRGLSVNVEAATQHQPCTVTINTPGSYTITGGSNTYTADAGDDVIFDLHIYNIISVNGSFVRSLTAFFRKENCLVKSNDDCVVFGYFTGKYLCITFFQIGIFVIKFYGHLRYSFS